MEQVSEVEMFANDIRLEFIFVIAMGNCFYNILEMLIPGLARVKTAHYQPQISPKVFGFQDKIKIFEKHFKQSCV